MDYLKMKERQANNMEENVKQVTDAERIAGHVCRILMNQMQYTPEFADTPVPMQVAERVLGMCADQIRNRMEDGTLDIGFIFQAPKKRGKRAYRNTYISPKKFWEVTGYVWKGEKS